MTYFYAIISSHNEEHRNLCQIWLHINNESLKDPSESLTHYGSLEEKW